MSDTLTRFDGLERRHPEALWVALPTSRSARWLLPRLPGPAANGSLYVYHPVTRRGRIGWKAAQALARAGAFRFLRKSSLLPTEVWQAVSPLIPPGGTVSVATSNHPGRYLSLVVRANGDPVGVVKVARDTFGSEAIRGEREALERFGSLLPAPLFAPRVLGYSEGVLVLEPIAWVPRPEPWKLPEEVALALGEFYRKCASPSDPLRGPAHGDFAPWNLLETRSGWALIDWENTNPSASPFFDLFHFLVQASVELRRPSKNALIEGLHLQGRVGRLLQAYADGCEIDPRETHHFFSDYLRISAAEIAPSAPRRSLTIRRRLSRMAARSRPRP